MGATTTWIPIGERLPEPWATVKVRFDGGDEGLARLACIDSRSLWMEPDSDYLVPDVTHWKPTPRTQEPSNA